MAATAADKLPIDVTTTMKLYLEFDSSQTPTHRARLDYALRCFCAIYGHSPVQQEEAHRANIWISYAARTLCPPEKKILQLPNLYTPRPVHILAPEPSRRRIGDAQVVLIHGCTDRGPDWLGEIFEWLSCADEHAIVEIDAVGRVPFSHSFVGRHSLSPLVPYAAIAMRYLQYAIDALTSSQGNVACPRPGVSQFIVNTHDVDSFPLSRGTSIRRLAKNAAISLVRERALLLACEQLLLMMRLAVGGRSAFLPIERLAEQEVRLGVGASYYFLMRNGHPRDGDYKVNDPRVVQCMRELERLGMEVGVHGTYCCLDDSDGLASEFNTLRSMGIDAKGGRLHWLRFSLSSLIRSARRGNAMYDSSLGWAETVGFRGGACFAFPLYDFAMERPAPFLELPLMMMDAALLLAGSRSNALSVADELLRTCRTYGWGGVSILWHPASFGGGQLPEWIGDVFTDFQRRSLESSDAWVSARDFVDAVQDRYIAVGLLPAARISEVFEACQRRTG